MLTALMNVTDAAWATEVLGCNKSVTRNLHTHHFRTSYGVLMLFQKADMTACAGSAHA